MQYLVIARDKLKEIGLSDVIGSLYREAGMDAHILEKMLATHGRRLTKDRKGVLVGFDPEHDLKVGVRLGLAQDGEVAEADTFIAPMMIEDDDTIPKAVDVGVDACIDLTRTNRSYYLEQIYPRGWVVWTDHITEEPYLVRNHIANVKNLQRHNERFEGEAMA